MNDRLITLTPGEEVAPNESLMGFQLPLALIL